MQTISNSYSHGIKKFSFLQISYFVDQFHNMLINISYITTYLQEIYSDK